MLGRRARSSAFEVSTIRVSGWDNVIPPAYAGGTDSLMQSEEQND